MVELEQPINKPTLAPVSINPRRIFTNIRQLRPSQLVDGIKLFARYRYGGSSHRNLARINAQVMAEKFKWTTSDSIFLALWSQITDTDVVKDVNNLNSFIQAYSGFAHIWNIADHLVDNTGLPVQEITLGGLRHDQGYKTYVQESGKPVQTSITLFESQTQLLAGMNGLFDDPRKKRELLLLVGRFRTNAVKNLKLPEFNTTQRCLPFDVAYKFKQFITGELVETTVRLYSLLLDIPAEKIDRDAKLGRQLAISMQFGDDLVDWYEDLVRQRLDRSWHFSQSKPLENLLLSKLFENPSELAAIELHSENSPGPHLNYYDMFKKFAPQTLAAYNNRFEQELAKMPIHPQRQFAQNICRLAYYQVLPNLNKYVFKDNELNTGLYSLASKAMKT